MATTQDIQNWLLQNPKASDAEIAKAMEQSGVTPAQLAAATGKSVGSVPTTSTTTSAATSNLPPYSQTNQQQGIAPYAQPYVGALMGATMGQLFNTDASGNITGMKGYTPYSYNPADYFAAFTPLQQQAQAGIAALKAPVQTDIASAATLEAINRAFDTKYTPTAAPVATVAAPQLFNYQMQKPADVQAAAMQAAQLGAAPTMQAASIAGVAPIDFTKVASSPITAAMMEAAQTNYAPTLQAYQMGPADAVTTKSLADYGALEKYMSPYVKNVVDVQSQEAKRQAAIAAQALGGKAATSGSFGGAGYALQRAQADAALQRTLANIQAQGLQTAYGQAQQQFNAEQQAALQAAVANQQAGLTVGQQNLAAQLGVQQLATQAGLQVAFANLSNQQQAAVQNQAAQLQAAGMNATQALQAAIANQQAGMQTNQFNAQQALNTQIQNAQFQQQAAAANQSMAGQYGLTQAQLQQAANLANQQAANQVALANQQAGLTVGQQNLAANLAVQNLGAGQSLQAQQANQAAQQAANTLAANQQQFGANLGLQGLQTALTGANQLNALGTTGLQNQLNVLNAQTAAGAAQQKQQQDIINQGVQNYQTAQQYPYMQLGFMQNMMQGLPATTTASQTYQAPPSTAAQLAGLATTGLGLDKLTGGAISSAIGSGLSTIGSGIGSMLGLAQGGTVTSDRPAGLAELAISKM